VTIGSEGRERILNEAYLLFIRHGFAEVSMQQIADTAGLTKATMYHHFRSKEDLFASVCRRELERMSAGVSELLAVGGPLAARLERVARFFLVAGGDSDFVRLFSDFRRHLPDELRKTLTGDVKPPTEMLLPLFEAAVAGGELRPVDPGLAVEMFFGLVMGQIKFAMDGQSERPPDPERAVLLVDALLHGIGATKPASVPA
jgi:AcrR family transcriptional regulator